MKRTTKKQKKLLSTKYKIIHMVDDLILLEQNEDKKEVLRILKKEFINNYGDYKSITNEDRG